jgi:hypothetical protein
MRRRESRPPIPSLQPLAAASMALAVALAAAPVAAQTPAPAPVPRGKPGARGRPAPSPAEAASGAPIEARFRLVLNFAAMPGGLSYGDVRSPIAYAETSTIRTDYDTGTGLGPQGALQVSLYRGLGLLAGYTHTSRDATGTLDASRPHPLYLNRPRTASTELADFSYTEGAFDVDAAYARSAGSLDYALFAGVTFFQVEADLVDVPTFDERYPYDTLTILSTPKVGVSESATGFNVGGRLDYRFGQSKRFGVGVQLRYSSASVELKANQDATAATIDAGGLSVGGGLRVYF